MIRRFAAFLNIISFASLVGIIWYVFQHRLDQAQLLVCVEANPAPFISTLGFFLVTTLYLGVVNLLGTEPAAEPGLHSVKERTEKDSCQCCEPKEPTFVAKNPDVGKTPIRQPVVEPVMVPKPEPRREPKLEPEPEPKPDPRIEVREEPKPVPQSIVPLVDEKGVPAAAYQILFMFQKEGRLLDFLMEDISGVDNEDLGGAIRPIHEGCKQILRDRLIIEPVLAQAEGETVQLGQTVDSNSFKLTGNVPVQGPYSGTLIHSGWRLKTCKMPELVSGWKGDVIVPAEVEIS